MSGVAEKIGWKEGRCQSPEEQASAGVSDDFIRLSIGIEDIDDILADLDQAIAKSQG